MIWTVKYTIRDDKGRMTAAKKVYVRAPQLEIALYEFKQQVAFGSGYPEIESINPNHSMMLIESELPYGSVRMDRCE
jgi:hypothetical protein